MIADHLTGIEQFDAGLWKMADDLRANSGLASNEYFMPIMGLLFLRQATNRYYEALAAIEADKAAGKMPDRQLVEADFRRRRAMMLPEPARYDVILDKPKDGKLGEALTAAMEAVEAHFPPLAGQLPKDYERFDDELLESMMRKFDTEALRAASGDVFGRIYEYFLAEFSKQGAHDNGEFFTPPSIVQTIVNVIEPDHGIVLDPACGSGGMFVQSSHFIEDAGQDTMKRVTFYGHEKNETTAKLAQINCHLEVSVSDDDDHRFIPGLDVEATLVAEDGETVGPFTVPFLWHPGLYHYGTNIKVPGDGTYDVKVKIAPPRFARHDKTNGKRYADPVEVEFPEVDIETGRD